MYEVRLPTESGRGPKATLYPPDKILLRGLGQLSVCPNSSDKKLGNTLNFKWPRESFSRQQSPACRLLYICDPRNHPFFSLYRPSNLLFCNTAWFLKLLLLICFWKTVHFAAVVMLLLLLFWAHSIFSGNDGPLRPNKTIVQIKKLNFTFLLTSWLICEFPWLNPLLTVAPFIMCKIVSESIPTEIFRPVTFFLPYKANSFLTISCLFSSFPLQQNYLNALTPLPNALKEKLFQRRFDRPAFRENCI